MGYLLFCLSTRICSNATGNNSKNQLKLELQTCKRFYFYKIKAGPQRRIMDMLFRLRRNTNGIEIYALLRHLLRYKQCDKGVYYPTLLCRVQITLEMSTDITRYLYLVQLASSSFPWPRKGYKAWQVRILRKEIVR